MKEKSQIVISISRQIGSGGAYIGQQLAQQLNILYLDREIINRAAKQLSVLEEELESYDERVPSFWQSFFQLGGCASLDMYVPPQIFVPTDHELFKVEAEIINGISSEHSAVIIGRCGSHILHGHPNHTSIFLHANNEFRQGRIQELYQVSSEAASKMIVQSDKERARYHQMHTGKEWVDARQYDLSIDTSKIGVNNSVQLILQYLALS